jgi:Zn finger protein HypA/HybF involved in hydrogenase expression
MKFAGRFLDQNEERIEKQANEALTKVKEDNDKLTEEQLEELKEVLKKQFASKYMLLSCPICGRQDGEIEQGFLCMDCIESAAVVHGKYKIRFILGNILIGDTVYRHIDGWKNAIEDEELVHKQAEILDISTSLGLDVFDLNLKIENDIDWLKEQSKELSERSIIVIEWNNSNMYVLRCNNCDSANLLPVNMISCPDCGKIYIPFSPDIIPLRDNREENRETPCFMVNSHKGDRFIVSECNEKKNQIEGINALRIVGPEDIDREKEDIICSYSLSEE